MSREAEVATRLRADATLAAILTGGVYAAEVIGLEGLTDPNTSPDVFVSGLMQPFALISERAPVDEFAVIDEGEQVVGETIVVGCWLYQRIESDAIKAARDRIYVLLQGHRFTRAWRAVRVFTLPVTPEPNLTGVQMTRVDYQIRSIKRV